MSAGYSPVVLDSISPDTFPQVDLFVKQHNSFTLYKPADAKLTPENLERLQEANVDFVFVRAAGAEEVQAALEKDLDTLMAKPDLSPMSRNLIFSHVIISCINSVFKNPGVAVEFHKCRSMLQRMELDLDDKDDVIRLFSRLKAYEKYLVVHTAQTAILSMFLYDKMIGAGKKEQIEIGLGAMLHDIGMLYISNNITEKTDTLTEQEYRRVKYHPKESLEILRKAGMTERVVLDVALDHHERYDGSGYPRGLHGDAIPVHSMVMNICDIYCALTMDRPYKTASTPEEALKTMRLEKKLFQPQVFDSFLEIMRHVHHPSHEQEARRTSADSGSNAAQLSTDEYRRQMRGAGGDRVKLMKLHTLITDHINETYGEEREALTKFRQELKDFMKSSASVE